VAKRLVRRDDGAASGEIAVRDPFMLVRHLARSQPDPRKAVAELVQNALDEQATAISITRSKSGGTTKLAIRDDGKGVLPQLPRPQALESIAKNIGNSRKRQMTFDERMQAAMLGQFGIGLLGFWNIGHELRMVSRVDNSDVWCLSLIEDSAKFEVFKLPDIGLFAAGTWTEIQVLRVHQAAIAATAGPRLRHYLAMELRGQLIRHGTELTIEDALVRKSSERKSVVKPAELAGERLATAETLAVDGFAYPAELSLYYAGDDIDESIALRLAAGGAVILDDVAAHASFDHSPWNDPALAGIIDFPHLEVPPGSRRGVVTNAAFDALCVALTLVAPTVEAAIADKRVQQASQVTAVAQKQLSKWFANAAQLVPHLDWFSIARPKLGLGEADGSATGGHNVPAPADGQTQDADEITSSEPSLAPEPESGSLDLFPPGPCTSVKIRPKRASIAIGETRIFTVERFDANDQATSHGTLETLVVGGIVATVLDADRVSVTAGPNVGKAMLTVEIVDDLANVVAPKATAEITLALIGNSSDNSGIPAPVEVDEPQKTWRSRWIGETWQINVGHPDAKRFADNPRGRMQYLAYLLAKEVIARNFARPEIAAVLEEMVGLLAALEASRK
jgi:hypothetical protein